MEYPVYSIIYNTKKVFCQDIENFSFLFIDPFSFAGYISGCKIRKGVCCIMESVESICRILRRELEEGIFAPGGKFPSEYELAQRFSVNKKTANKAVSLLANQGYLLRGTRGQNTRVAASLPFPKGYFLLLASQYLNSYVTKILRGMQRTALQHNYLVCWAAPPVADLKYFMNSLSNSSVKGIVSFAYGAVECPLPLICVDEPERNLTEKDNLISCNNFEGAYSMMKTVIERGHREIVVCFNTNVMASRLEGFRKAMEDGGISDIDKRIFAARGYLSEPGPEEAVSVLRKIRKTFPRCSAIVCGSDHQMHHLIGALNKLEIPWRNRLALTGFGNLDETDPSLPVASVDQYPDEIGSLAVEHLINIVEHGQTPYGIRETTSVELVNVSNIPILLQ